MRDGERQPDTDPARASTGADVNASSKPGASKSAGADDTVGATPDELAATVAPSAGANPDGLAATVAPSVATDPPPRRERRARTKPGTGTGGASAALDETVLPVATPAPDKPAGTTRPGAGVAETLPAPAAPPRAKSATQDTHPGPGVGAKHAPGVAETLPVGTGSTKAELGETLMGSVAPSALAHDGPIIRPPQHDQTAAAGSETLGGPGPAGHAATLQGPYTVADLPSLPRVDDDTYAIGPEIARGGMGKILAARDRKLRREVVIKVMRREYGRIDPRFEREALITARLQHPSIVRVYDAGVLGDGRAFYSMERVRGRSLEVVLAETKTLRERLALLPHAIAVCEALAYAHNEGVVHRDLKPSNVLLGPFGETVVIDWGLAKDLRTSSGDSLQPFPAVSSDGDETLGDSEQPDSDSGERGGGSGSGPRSGGTAAEDSSSAQLTQLGAVMGTPTYMAPEQARGEVADERTDIYALGALLYTLLTGSPPVSGSSSDEVIDAVASGKRARIDVAEPELPPELVSIVERAMATERDERYQTAKELAADLSSFTAGKLVPSHEYSTWELVKRWIARHRLTVAVAAIAIMMLAGMGTWAFVKVSRARDRAERAQRFAEDERDNLILEQARSMRTSDPSMAAAWLKHLSTRALELDDTVTLAAELARSGLSFQMAGHRNSVENVTASPDGIHVASASDDGLIRVWDVRDLSFMELTGHAGPIDTMVASGDGQFLATSGADHKVILWTLATGAKRELLGHGQAVRGVAFSADNSKLASTAEDGSLFVWDVATATGEKVLHYTHAVRPVAWLDDHTLVVGAFNGALGRVDIATHAVHWMHEHESEMRSVAITPDHAMWVATDEDGHITLWDAATNKKIRDLKSQDDVGRKAIITRDGKYVVVAGGSTEVQVDSLPDGAVVELKGNESGIKDIGVTADGLVASAGIDNTVRVWRLDGTPLHTWRGHTASVKGLAFVGRYVVSGAEDNMVRRWSLDAPPPPPRGEALRAWLERYTNAVTTSGVP